MFTYSPVGTCSRQILFDVDSENRLHNVRFIGGCSGNLQGIARLVEGKTLEEVARQMLITRERVRQLERKFIYLLKRPQYQDILKFGPEYADKKYRQTELLEKLDEYNQLLEFEIYKKEEAAKEKFLDGDLMLPIRKFGLSTRATNCLGRAGIEYLGDLVNKSRFDLMKIRNLGKEALKEITEFVESKGYKLKGESDEKFN